jgi:hypothetical protein
MKLLIFLKSQRAVWRTRPGASPAERIPEAHGIVSQASRIGARRQMAITVHLSARQLDPIAKSACLSPVKRTTSAARFPSTANWPLGRVSVLRESPIPSIATWCGASHWWVFTRHILPSVLGVVLVYASADAGALVLSIATLSFLGLGVTPPTAEWGQMLVDGMNYLEDSPSMVLLPGLALTLVVVSFNVLGEAIALQKLPRAIKGRVLLKRIRARADEEKAIKRGVQ